MFSQRFCRFDWQFSLNVSLFEMKSYCCVVIPREILMVSVCTSKWETAIIPHPSLSMTFNLGSVVAVIFRQTLGDFFRVWKEIGHCRSYYTKLLAKFVFFRSNNGIQRICTALRPCLYVYYLRDRKWRRELFYARGDKTWIYNWKYR